MAFQTKQVLLQWGVKGSSTNATGTFAIAFKTIYTAVVMGSPSYPSREFCGFSCWYSTTQFNFRAGHGGPGVSYVSTPAYCIAVGI